MPARAATRALLLAAAVAAAAAAAVPRGVAGDVPVASPDVVLPDPFYAETRAAGAARGRGSRGVYAGLSASPAPEVDAYALEAGDARAAPREPADRPVCYVQAVELAAGTAERCCEERHGCGSAECAGSEACKGSSDVGHCRVKSCTKMHFYLSEKPVHRLDASCAKDLHTL